MVPLPGRSGVKYVSNLKNFARKPITVDDLRRFSKTLYGKSLYLKIATMVFHKTLKLAVYDPKNNIDETAQTLLSRAFLSESFNLVSAGQIRLFDKFFYGPGIFNPAWVKVGGTAVPSDLGRLPPYTFSKLPTGREKYSDLLPGITLNPDGETIECWQKIGTANPVLLDPSCIYIVQSPVIDGLVESPMIEPIIPFIDMLLFGWETGMQVMKRGAAPILFIKITNPNPASSANGDVSDEDYAAMILENWDKDTAFSLRSNMEIVPFSYDNTISLDIIEGLYSVIIDYFNPASFINRDGNQMGGSQQGQLELFAAFIGGIQAEIEVALTHIVNKYFVYNFYPEGYRAEITIPRMDTRNRDLDIKEVEVGAEYCILDLNECRQRLQADGLDDDAVATMLDQWKRVRDVAGASSVTKTTVSAASNLSKEDLPGYIRQIPSEETLASNLERDLGRMIDDATKDLIAAVQGS